MHSPYITYLYGHHNNRSVKPSSDNFTVTLTSRIVTVSDRRNWYYAPPSQPSAPDIWFKRNWTVCAERMGKTGTGYRAARYTSRSRRRAFRRSCDATTSTQLLPSRIPKIIGVTPNLGESLLTAM